MPSSGSISLNIGTISSNIGTLGMNRRNKCWVAVVAGSFLDDVQSVLDRVDSLSDEMQMVAYAVFLLGDTGNTGYNRNHMSAPLVSMIKNKLFVSQLW